MRRMILVLTLLGVACTRAPLSNEDSVGTRPPGSSVEPQPGDPDWQAILKLEEAAKAIAKPNGCASSGDCRAGAVGSRACGGPRYYLTYCARSTDSAALYRKLDEIATAEKAYNAKHQIMSTCEFRMAPAVESVNGVCTAK